jgi:hypothetical protein
MAYAKSRTAQRVSSPINRRDLCALMTPNVSSFPVSVSSRVTARVRANDRERVSLAITGPLHLASAKRLPRRVRGRGRGREGGRGSLLSKRGALTRYFLQLRELPARPLPPPPPPEGVIFLGDCYSRVPFALPCPLPVLLQPPPSQLPRLLP